MAPTKSLGALHEQLQVWQNTLNDHDSEFKRLVTLLDDLNRRVKEIDQGPDSLWTRLSNLAQEIKTLESKLQPVIIPHATTTATDAATNQSKDQDTREARLTGEKLALLETRLLVIEHDNNKLMTRSLNQKQLLSGTREQVTAAENNIKNITEREMKQMGEKFARVDRELDSLRRSYEKAEEGIADSRRQVESTNASVAALSARVEVILRRLDEVMQTMHESRGTQDTESWNLRVSSLERVVEQQHQARTADTTAALNRRIESLNQELSNIDRRLADFQRVLVQDQVEFRGTTEAVRHRVHRLERYLSHTTYCCAVM